MKRKVLMIVLGIVFTVSSAFAITNTGAVWLLIAPGARAEAMGEAHVAIANDAYASYYNPAGLAYMAKNEIGAMYSKWLPNLVNDMYYTFLAGGYHVPNVGTFGGHAIYLNLGEQQWTDEYGNSLGTFTSYMTAISASYATKITKNSSIGVNLKFAYQMLSQVGGGDEHGDGDSFHLGFDLGYQVRNLLNDRLDLGFAISNVGPKIAFIDKAQADPQPTNLKMGFNINILKQEHNDLSFVLDLNRILASSHPSMDANDNYIIEMGKPLDTDFGEESYTDNWFTGIFTSFTDDWHYAGDIDYSGDGIIGGYNAEGEKQGWYNIYGEEIVAVSSADGSTAGYWYNADAEAPVTAPGEYNEGGGSANFAGWGEYGSNAGQFQDDIKEVGSESTGKFSNELREIILNTGIEYVYNKMFALRAGFIYDQEGDVMSPTIGFGFIYKGLGFDFAYTGGAEGHPLANTMRYSLRYEF
ncbi:MAG: PorV/PorQ family protein [Candidatus Marinimicrobia bacterium]|nr:PorV/PorQ family protein [Candidatus Neomarinimicrobiota bacterium]